MKKILLSILSVILALISFADNYTKQDSIDIVHYKFEISLSDSTNKITGKTTVDFGIPDGFCHHVTLDLREDMKVHSVVDGNFKPLRFQHRLGKLHIKLDTMFVGNQQLIIEYKGTPTNGLIIDKTKHGDRSFFADNWPNRASYWIPCIDHPYEKATHEFLVTAPEHYDVVSNGTLQTIAPLPNKMELTHWSSSVVLPTKVMVIGVAEFAIDKYVSDSNIAMSSWVYPQEMEKGFYDYKMAGEITDWFIRKIGPYPYEKLANVQSKTMFGGMENAGCIFYHEESIDGKRGSEELFAHEIAHQWFGNSISEKEWEHIWISEGFATYLTQVYVEEKYGRDKMNEGMAKEKEKVIAFEAKAPNKAIVSTDHKSLMELLSPLTYQKAAWVLHMLRYQLGDEVFWKGIKRYYNEYKLQNVTSIEFQKIMEKVSKRNLDNFFTTWLYSPGVPEINVTGAYNEKTSKYDLKITQESNSVIPYEFKLQLHFVDENGAIILDKTLGIAQSISEISISLNKKPTDIILDPNRWLIMDIQKSLN